MNWHRSSDLNVDSQWSVLMVASCRPREALYKTRILALENDKWKVVRLWSFHHSKAFCLNHMIDVLCYHNMWRDPWKRGRKIFVEMYVIFLRWNSLYALLQYRAWKSPFKLTFHSKGCLWTAISFSEHLIFLMLMTSKVFIKTTGYQL